jgi:choline/glycine/proline betaine transport protein
MLFAAGMGIGLVFWGVSEPILHYADPQTAEPASPAARDEALVLSYFHWGLHAWAIYIVFALAVAYFHFNRGLPLAPRIILQPLIGERIEGPIGHFVDILCTVGTLLGVATSLGLGAMQINTSLATFFGWPEATFVQIALIAGITVVATISVVLGVKGGIRRLSLLNLWLAAALLAFVFVTGPTLFVIEVFVSTLGAYLERLPRLSLHLDPGTGSEWQATWTLFYWGWWISWSPFVAIFVARISKGRTVGEFVTGVLLVPAVVTFLWFAVFGGTAIHLQSTGAADIAALVEENNAASLQALLAALPLGTITTVVATILITAFFVTSSDSGSLVDDMVTSGGDPHPPRVQRVFWATAEGVVAAILLLVGGLTAIRNAAISFGLVMSLLLIAAMVAVWVGMRADPARRRPSGTR